MKLVSLSNEDIQDCMTVNFTFKTKVVPKHLRETLSHLIISLDGITLTFSSTVRNLGLIFDQDMSFVLYIKQVSRVAFFHLHNIMKIRSILSQEDAFVTTRFDYCNSFLCGCSNKSLKDLQLI